MASSLRQRAGAVLGLFGFVAASVLIFWGIFALLDASNELTSKPTGAPAPDGGVRPAARVVVGSKAFTEGILLAEIMAQLVERETDLVVLRRTNLGGTQICFQALRSGSIDFYAEYTGTGLTAILKEESLKDPDEVYRIVSERFRERYELTWLPPLGFDNTYALAMRRKQAEQLEVSTIAELRAHPKLRVGFPTEFMARPDGWPGLRTEYALEFSRPPRGMEAGLMYSAARDGQVDVIGAYSTDGRIAKFDLLVLKDNRGFFPPYQAAPLVRSAALRTHPALGRALSKLAGKLTEAQLQRLNAAVDIEGRSVEDVAREVVQTVP